MTNNSTQRQFNDAAGRCAQSFFGATLLVAGALATPFLANMALGGMAGWLIANACLAKRPVLPALASAFASACKRACHRAPAGHVTLGLSARPPRP